MRRTGLLQQRWAQAKEGAGQVVLARWRGRDWQIPPGAGAQRASQRRRSDPHRVSLFSLSPEQRSSIQSSSIYSGSCSLREEDAPQAKLTKLQQPLGVIRFPQADTLPLLATLLSLPQPEGAPPLTLSPQKQKQKTQEALVAWIARGSREGRRVLCLGRSALGRSLHLGVLTLFLDQVPTTRLLALLTFRPEFLPPWGNRSHLTQLMLSRLGRPQVEAMVEQVTGGKALPVRRPASKS